MAGLPSLSHYRALLLDKAYRPLRAVGWQRAVVLDLSARVEVLEYYDRLVQTARDAFPLPAVIRTPSWIERRPRSAPLTRRNVLLRDDHTCQYCGIEGTSRELTIDHVQPRSRGGPTSWENVAAACGPCNRRKGDRTPDEARMPLARVPRRPSALQLGRRGMVLGEFPDEWEAYLVTR
jgi:5-methylcytosine-specific restriction endonuclease McrA